MNSSKITEAKFYSCLNPLTCSYYLSEKEDNNGNTFDGGIDFTTFSLLMIKNDLNEYTNLLFDYLNWQLISSRSTKSQYDKLAKLNSKIDEEIQLKKDLTNILYCFLSKKEEDKISITFQAKEGPIITWNNNIVQSIINKMIDDFKENGYDLDPLSEDEAEKEIRQEVDKEWIEDWPKIQKNYDSDGNLIVNSNIMNEPGESLGKDENIFDNTISKKMIRAYAESHEKAREIDLDYLKKVINEGGFNDKKDAGAKGKIKHIKSLMIDLSYLCRIDKFLQSEDDTNDIEQIKLTAPNRQFIYDCLEIYGFIDSSITTAPKKYVTETLSSAMTDDGPLMATAWRNKIITSLKSKINSKS